MAMNKKYDAAWMDDRAEYFSGIYQEIKQLRDCGLFYGKRIGIVGVWLNAREVKMVLEDLSLKLDFIADNNPNKQGVAKLGLTSQSVETLAREPNTIILILNNYAWKELKNQMDVLGLVENENYYVCFGGEKYKRLEQRKYDLIVPDENWSERRKSALDGYKEYIKIYDKYNRRPIWLMHQPSLGDLYLFSLFLPYAMGVDRIEDCDCVLIVSKNSLKKLAEILGFRNIELITLDEASKNWITIMQMMGDKVNIQNAVFHGVNGIFVLLKDYSTVTFRDSITNYVFHLKEDVVPIYPSFPKRTDYVREIFGRYGLQPGRTILISPYAGHFIPEISQEQWGRLVNGLKKKGYCVCTNSGGENEPALDGTFAPFIELQDCVEFVEMAGYFIGVRSGFCDLLCMAKCHKIIIYETGAPAGSIAYFGFESMGLGENIVEIVNDCIHTDQMIENILEQYEIKK